MSNHFLPEGQLLDTPENKAACSSFSSLQHAMETGRILEGRCFLCTAEHDLLVQVGSCTGRIPREECAIGIREGSTREIAVLSRVGKPVCFLLTDLQTENGAPVLTLSRRAAQEAALDVFLEKLPAGAVIPATVTHMESFGVFVDIGCGVVSMISIENISIARIPHPDRRFRIGQRIYAAVTGTDRDLRRIYLTHKELLGTWEENAAQFAPGMTVPGTVRGIKDYGAFVELTPNLTGLADLTPEIQEGDRVSVYIKSILPDRMKCKLLVIDKLDPESGPPPLHYYITGGRLSHWRYAPATCDKPGLTTCFL